MRVCNVVVAHVPVLAFAALLAPACGSSSEVSEASCSDCQATSSAAQCSEWGQAAGCKSSKLGSGSCASCNFEECDSPPECGTGTSNLDAGNEPDVMLDPECANAPDGLFSVIPPCDPYGTIMVNGQTSYTCGCTDGCPCNFECGSIDLPSGGTVSGVCAPPP